MKQTFFILFLFITLASCGESEETKIISACKRYTEDYFFKNNLKIEIVDFKINSQKELNLIEADSVIKKFAENKLLNVAIKLSGQTASDFLSMENPWRLKFISEAGKSTEYDLYVQKLKELDYKAFEVHAYLKYVTSDSNGNNKQNRLYEDCVYLISKDYKIIDMMSLQ